ncbi:MAG: hypothetical protein AB7F36_08220 [Reyranellaceae bacterium]
MSNAPGAAVVVAESFDSGNAARSYIDWPAIIAGAVFASAISFVLFAFGSAVGLGILSPYRGEGAPALTAVLLSAVWVIFVAVGSFMSGAYLTGRLRRRFYDANEDESTRRDGAHGLLVWALAVLIGIVMAAGMTATLARSGAAAAGAAASAAGQADGDFDLVTDRLFRAAPDAAASTPASTTATGATETGPTRGETRGEVDRILSGGIVRGEISTEDRGYIARLVARETGLAPAEAEQRVNATLDSAIAEAKRIADIARKTGVMVAFLVAATLMVSAVGAYWAAARGGDHRDNNTDLGIFR